MTTTSRNTPRLPAGLLRRVAVAASVDPRSVIRELERAGSVRGMAGDRIRRALLELGDDMRAKPAE